MHHVVVLQVERVSRARSVLHALLLKPSRLLLKVSPFSSLSRESFSTWPTERVTDTLPNQSDWIGPDRLRGNSTNLMKNRNG